MAALQSGKQLMCSMCLEFFKAPKVFPCNHALCEECLQRSATVKDDASFTTCPRCHVRMVFPDGSLEEPSTQLQLLSPTVRDGKDTGDNPSALPTSTASHLCKNCDALVCESCRQGNPSSQKLKPTTDAISRPNVEQRDLMNRVPLCEQQLQSVLQTIRLAEQTVHDKQKAMDAQIRARKEILLQWVNDAFIKSLTALEGTSKKLIAQLHVADAVLAEKLLTVQAIKKGVLNGQHEDIQRRIPPVPTEPGEAGTDTHRLQRLVSNLPFHPDIQALHFNDQSVTLTSLVNFMGVTVPFQPVPLLSEMTVTLAFRCCEDPETDVYALCPVERKVWVSYGHSFSNTRGEVSLFTEQGVAERTQFTGSGVSVARVRDGWVVAEGRGSKTWLMSPRRSSEKEYTIIDREYRLFCKLNARYCLYYPKDGRSELRTLDITDSQDGLPEMDSTKLCDLSLSARPLAMDVSRNGKLVAVLEEGNDTVLIFNHSLDPAPSVTYSPTVDDVSVTFKPRDLCFFPFGGQERLVVADYLNDVLLVLHVNEEKCVLIGHLEDKGGDLLKPTAVSGDDEGRLWVGCRGGKVLLMKIRQR